MAASYRAAGVTYVKLDRDDYVSADWHTILTDLIRRRVIGPEDVNDGHRTIALQAQRVREQGVYHPVSNPHGAARPSSSAPHIRIGRGDHALDVNPAVIDDLIRACRSLYGLRVGRTVSTEPWHVEALDGPAALRHAAIRAKWSGFTAAERRWITEYDRLKARGLDRQRRRVLRRVMTKQRKRIWRAAQGSGGWSKANRAARYRSLRARTT